MNTYKRILVALMFMPFTLNAWAGELNPRTHLPTAVQAKVDGLLAHTYAQGNTKTQKNTVTSNSASAGQQVEIGSSHNAKNAPRQQNTVVNGPVNVICHHCYGH